MLQQKQILLDTLKHHNQEHLIQFYDHLDEADQHKLTNEIQSIDFKDLTEKFLQTKSYSTKLSSKLDSCMQPIASELKGSYQNSSKEQLDRYESIGLRAIAAGEVAVVLLAGGQGTRLGVNYPKGMYSVGLPSEKTLFQLQAERLRRVQELASVVVETDGTDSSSSKSVPWYIMTSENTHTKIKDYFAEKQFFGLEGKDVKFFEQGTLPCLTMDGKLLLDQKNKISRAPDGNGGLYKAILEKKVLEDMASRRIKFVHVYCVDNILIRIADPVFIGFCIEKQANCAAKVVRKTEPDEQVGVICRVNEKYQVVEYSEISEETRNLRDENGDLAYNAGNICNHFLTFEFLEEVCKHHEKNLTHHIAEKKINYIDDTGILKKPTFKNGIKLEKFIFDIFPFSKKFAIWEVVRRDEFSPLKNGKNDSGDNEVTCRKHILEQHARWMESAFENAGVPLKRLGTDIEFEISPLVSYSGEGLETYAEADLSIPEIPPKAVMYLERSVCDLFGLAWMVKWV